MSNQERWRLDGLAWCKGNANECSAVQPPSKNPDSGARVFIDKG